MLRFLFLLPFLLFFESHHVFCCPICRCVTNEKLISPFRGTYNSDDGHQVSLYAYLKAFRFTGSPALYLECDIHMCHNKCPVSFCSFLSNMDSHVTSFFSIRKTHQPQRCYWRNLSKRSVRSAADGSANETSVASEKPVISESISLFQALEVRHESEDEDKKSEEYSKLPADCQLLEYQIVSFLIPQASRWA